MEPGVGGAPPRGREQQDERPLRGLWRWGGCAAERRNDGRRRRRGRGKRGRIEPDPGRANPPHDRSTGAADPSRPWRATAARCGTGREGLVRGALWLLVALQGPPLDLQARVDRARPATGEEPTAYGRARPLIAAAAPPARNDRVALSVILPGDTVLAGAQLDVIAAAWFPRSLRTRLRRAPILTLQTPEGVWSYPGAAPSDVVASRLVRGGWMDLYVAHLVVFPLVAGRVTIPTATVEYGVPVTFSFFSREERYFLKSDSVLVTVLPLPGADRSADDRRVTAQELALEVAVQPTEARVGEPLDATATVSGVGNVALWPEPVIHWPVGFRAYPGEATVRVEPRGGRMAGSKTFHYLVVADSAGSFLLPEVRYTYYDLTAGAYTAARAAPRPLAVAQGAEPRAARPLPPLDRSRGEAWVDAIAAQLFPLGWAALLVGPPLLVWLRRRRAARWGAASTEEPDAPPLSRLGRLEREFLGLLASHVPDPVARDGDGLARALRAAADSFAARAAAQPRVAAHWYNLGATLYRAGADGKAMAAWTRAARLAPRAPLVRRARQFLPPPDAASDPLLATGVATPAEWALAGAAGWVVLWLAVLSRRRGVVVVLLGLVTAGCAGLALREGRRRGPPRAGAGGARGPGG